jgi:hypothetical protein
MFRTPLRGSLEGRRSSTRRGPLRSTTSATTRATLATKRSLAASKCESVQQHLKISKYHAPWGHTRHRHPPSKSSTVFVLRPIERARNWRRTRHQHAPLQPVWRDSARTGFVQLRLMPILNSTTRKRCNTIAGHRRIHTTEGQRYTTCSIHRPPRHQ